MISPHELKDRLRSGMLSFPVTPFDRTDRFSREAFAAHLDWLSPHPVAGLVVAGGAGEFPSLTPDEVLDVVRAAKAAQPGVPVLAGCGYGTRMASDLARGIEAAGGDGILLLPHYLVVAPQAGMEAHVRAVCNATNMGVIVYNRGQMVLEPETVARLADACPNLIGFKDGTGDLDTLRAVAARVSGRLELLGGMPTHEVHARAYRDAGFDNYTSAVFNFAPATALAFYDAHRTGDDATCDRLLAEFFAPFAALRARQPGYAVSAIKAGVALRGFETGPVRPPLTDLDDEERAMLAALIEGRD